MLVRGEEHHVRWYGVIGFFGSNPCIYTYVGFRYDFGLFFSRCCLFNSLCTTIDGIMELFDCFQCFTKFVRFVFKIMLFVFVWPLKGPT